MYNMRVTPLERKMFRMLADKVYAKTGLPIVSHDYCVVAEKNLPYAIHPAYNVKASGYITVHILQTIIGNDAALKSKSTEYYLGEPIPPARISVGDAYLEGNDKTIHDIFDFLRGLL